jgi:hypothetical protein
MPTGMICPSGSSTSPAWRSAQARTGAPRKRRPAIARAAGGRSSGDASV